MPLFLADYLRRFAAHARSLDEPVLSHICGIAALEAQSKNVPALEDAGDVVGLWDWNIVEDSNHLDPGAAELFGIDPVLAREGCPNEVYCRAIHPDDVSAVTDCILTALSQGGIFHVRYRVIANNRVRSVLAKGLCTLDRSGRPERFPGAIIEYRTAAN